MSIRVARTARKFRTAVRPLSTTTRSVSRREGNSQQWKPVENLGWLHPRMIFVRPWDGVPSIAHAFAIIREVERRFGKIQEFVVLRDSDVWTNNLPYMHATFAQAEYTDAIPMEGRVIQVPIPTTDPDRPGGIGLDDLEVYLDPQIRARELSKMETRGTEYGKEQMAGPGIMMDVKLERTGMREPPAALDFMLGGRGHLRGTPLLRKPDKVKELADAMMAFGGFSTVIREPVDSAKPKPRMHMVMERWSSLAHKNPSSSSRQGETPDEPIVGPEPVPWVPFTQQGDISRPQITSVETEKEPLMSSSTLPPPPLPSTSLPSFVEETTPKTDATPQNTTSQSATAPSISRKQRMILAARVAGAKATMQPAENDYGNLRESGPDNLASTPSIGANKTDDENTEKCEDSNKKAASKWWGFLTGGR